MRGFLQVSAFAWWCVAGSSCGRDGCAAGMCGVPGVAMTEAEARRRASTFAYERLVSRQERSRDPVLGSDWKPLVPQPIDPGAWRVSRTDTGWRLTRHLTRDLWQVVECELDGSRAFDGMDVGPEPTAGNG